MRIVRNILAAIGLIVAILCLAGNLGIGNFRLYYGLDPVSCINTNNGYKIF